VRGEPGRVTNLVSTVLARSAEIEPRRPTARCRISETPNSTASAHVLRMQMQQPTAGATQLAGSHQRSG
jgi:hypothetical protein